MHGEALLFCGWAWLGGFLYHRCRANPLSGVLLVASLIGLCNINQVYNQRYSELTLIAVCLALIAGGSVKLHPLVKKGAIFLGDLSYPLYLFHFPTFYVLMPYLHHSGVAIQLVFASTVALFALGVDYTLSNPVKKSFEQLGDAAIALQVALHRNLTGLLHAWNARPNLQALAAEQMITHRTT